MPETFPVLKEEIETITKIPVFNTTVITYGNKVEQRISNISTPQYKFKLNFREVMLDEAVNTIMRFFEERKGTFEAFYFQNLEESYRGIKWQATKAYTVGDIVRPISYNGRSYKCTIAGISGSSQPIWPTTVNGTIADGSVTWKENTYLVRFETDLTNFDYFKYSYYILSELVLIEVSA